MVTTPRSTRRAFLALCGTASLAGCTALGQSGHSETITCDSHPGPWPTAGANAQRTHVAGSDGNLPGDEADLVQITGGSGAPVTGGVRTAPAVVDGTVYLVTKPGQLLAREGVEWTVELPTQAFATPAIACGTVFLTTGGTTHAFDPADGSERWQADSESVTSPAVVDETVYVGDFGGVVALDARSGDERWSRTYGSADTTHGVAATSDHVVLTTNAEHTGYLRCFTADGERRWKHDIGDVLSMPTIDDSYVYAGGQDGVLRAVELSTGTVAWETQVDRELETGLAVADGTVFVPGGASGNAYAVDAETGTIRWTQHVGISAGAPVLVGPELAVPGDAVPGTGADGDLPIGIAVLDANTGTIKRTYDLPGLDSALAVGDGTLYFANGADENLYALQ